MIKINEGIVFSNDIFRILNGKNALDFDYTKNGLIVPKECQIEVLREDFKKDTNKIFDNKVVIFSEKDMQNFMYDSLEDSLGYPIVSLDKIYFEGDNDSIFLDCTRLDKSKELVSRKNPNDLKSVDNQIKNISQKLTEEKRNEIILVDDVVFSGNVLNNLIKKFKENGVDVKGIRASISTEAGYKYFNKILEKGLKCGCLLGENVIDQICERDFYFGIAQSGISVANETKGILKSPYFRPFGDAVNRASIPRKYEDYFSKSCLMRSIFLWKCIEDNSGRKVTMSDMPEKIINTNNDDRVINILKKGLIYYEKNANRDYGECR